ncbi:MAG: DNA translocase FtsK 4TM domain-containing protein [Eggerthellaceae bacterium]|nr:DNA translocase FtsK 4TM domain-containing protein [Eggerthellaceae bacterium]
MPGQKKPSAKPKQSNQRKAKSPASRQVGKQSKVQAPSVAPSRKRMLDESSRRDIWGVVWAVLAIILFIMAVMQPTGMVTSVLSDVIHVSLGKGAFIIPFVMVLISAAFFVNTDAREVPARVAVGLLILFLSVLVLLALYTPGVSSETLEPLFARANLVNQGGYIGAGVAWVFMLLFGQVVSTVIVVGMMIVALVIIGFSFRRVIDRISRAREDLFDRSWEQTMPQSAVAVAPRARAIADKGLFDEDLLEGDDDVEIEKAVVAESTALTHKLGENKPRSKRGSESKTIALDEKKADPATPKPTEDFVLPSRDLLTVTPSGKKKREGEDVLRDTAVELQDTLSDFGVDATVAGWVAGPTVTLFKIDLPSGVRVSKVTNLTDDIARSLAAPGVRIFSPIPGTRYVGIEVPNIKPQTVLFGDILKSVKGGPLQMVVGEDVEGNYVIDDLSKMPHLLVGVTTGSGKSIAINGMIMSILMRATPAEVRFIMIDPKRVEFTPYNGIPHLYVPVVTECKEAASALAWAVAEMESRLKDFANAGARNISQYNKKVQDGLMKGDEPAEELPYIVIVIDELADLMMNVGKEVEASISRLAQLARAAGIHMIIATQRPSTNVVTGLIKANITCRIALNVASGIDSRVILDTTGAESLIGKGDMLYSKPEYPKPVRLQGCFTSPKEIEAVVEHLKTQGDPEYHNEILNTNLITLGSSMPDGSGGSGGVDDPLIWEAAEIVVNSGLGSTSNIQRRLSVGYSRAGRIMDMLEEKGVVGPPNGSKPREVLVDAMELESLKAFESQDANRE